MSIWLAVFFLPLRLGGTLYAPNIKPSEAFILIALIATGIQLFASSAFRSETASKFIQRKALPWIGLFYASLLIGTLASTIGFGMANLPWKFIAVEYIRVGVASLLFLLVLYHGIKDARFSRVLFFAFLSPAAIALLAHVPGAAEKLHMLDGNRLEGLMGDPNYFASLTLICAIFLVTLALFHKRFLVRILSFCGAALTLSAVLLSGSRSGVVGLFMGAFILGLSSVYFSKEKLKTVLILSVALVAVATLGYAFAHSTQPENVAERLDFLEGQDRIFLWTQALDSFSRQPLGYGPGYYQLTEIKNSSGELRVAHSIIFESLLIGGPLLLALFVFVVLYTKKAWLNIERPDMYWVGIFSAFAGVMTSSLFLDSLSLRWSWTLGALLIAHTYRHSMRNEGLIQRLVRIYHLLKRKVFSP